MITWRKASSVNAHEARKRAENAKEVSKIWLEEMCKSTIFPAIKEAADDEKFEVAVGVGYLNTHQLNILTTHLKELGYVVSDNDCYRDYDDEWFITINWKRR